MTEYLAKSEDLTAVADAIRAKAGTTEPLVWPEGFKEAVDGIAGGTVDNFIETLLGGGTYGTYRNEALTKIGNPVFRYWRESGSMLDTLDLPNVTNTVNEAFMGANIRCIKVPKLKSINSFVFRNNPLLEEVDVSGCVSAGMNCFTGDTAIQKLDFPALKSLTYFGHWQGCSSLETLILRYEGGVVGLPNVNCLAGTPIEAGTGYVYVPAALVDSYKAATNWSTYADQIRAIEDYPEITGG